MERLSITMSLQKTCIFVTILFAFIWIFGGCQSNPKVEDEEKDHELARVLEKLEKMGKKIDLLEGKHKDIDRKIEDVEKKIAEKQ